MAMNEARVRIMTNNTKQPVFSPQDIVDCSEYSQGNHKSETEVAVSVQKRTVAVVSTPQLNTLRVTQYVMVPRVLLGHFKSLEIYLSKEAF